MMKEGGVKKKLRERRVEKESKEGKVERRLVCWRLLMLERPTKT